jgi:large subunit ribosomal protein L17
MHRHSYSSRKLGRKSAQRKALMRGLATSVILYEKVKTTTPKAKEVQSIVEKLITVAKKGDLNAFRKLNTYVYGENAVQKLVTEIAPLYKERNGGYTRVVKVGYRAGDAAPMAIIELVDADKLVKKVIEKPKAEKTVKATPEKKTAVKKTTAKKPAAKKEDK